jgi:hypothetical protein
MCGCEPPCDCWDLNSGPLEEQSVLLPVETSSQPLFYFILFYFILFYFILFYFMCVDVSFLLTTNMCCSLGKFVVCVCVCVCVCVLTFQYLYSSSGPCSPHLYSTGAIVPQLSQSCFI